MSRDIQGYPCSYYDVPDSKPTKNQKYGAGDYEFIKEMLYQIPSNMRRNVTECYSKTYNRLLHDVTYKEYQRVGVARRAANIQLMRIVDAFNERSKPKEVRRMLQDGNGLPYQV